MTPSAVVVSVGARTPLGLTAMQTGFAYRAASVAMREAPLVADEEGGEGITMCFLPTIDPLMVGAERAVELALPALDEALLAIAPSIQKLRTRLVLCMDEQLGISGPDGKMPGSTVGAWVIQRATQLAPQTQLEISARGPAGPGFALQGVFDSLARGTIEAAILGGVHTDYDPARVQKLAQAGRLFKPDNLDSIIPGELAAFVVLMRPDVARMYKLAPLAQLFTVATAYDKVRPDNDEPAFEAIGLTVAVRKAGAPLLEAKLRAGWLLTDLSFETFRLYEHQSMLVRTQSLWMEPQQWDPPALRMGALGAAAMPLHVTLAAEGWRRGWAPHSVAFSCAGNDGGERAALLLTKP
jgi:3-oxoacyl-[acyl-carrier-protein] synthase I